jgi:hypothetical protein
MVRAPRPRARAGILRDVPSFGDPVDSFEVGAVRVTVRYGCVRRDQYELACPAPLPDALRERLGAHGAVRGSAMLYVVDVPETQQITVAARQGRVVIMPRLTLERPAQRAAAMEVARLVASMAGGEPPPGRGGTGGG